MKMNLKQSEAVESGHDDQQAEGGKGGGGFSLIEDLQAPGGDGLGGFPVKGWGLD